MIKFRTLLTYILLAGTTIAQAVPAMPGKRLFQMPDGTMREAILRGDEYCNWLESPTGIRLTPSRNAIKHHTNQHQQIKSYANGNSNMLIDGCFPTTGKRKLLALLVNYADTRPSVEQAAFQQMMNQENYKGVGSFRDYYLQQSYGQLDITTTVTRWVTVSNKHDYYIDNNVTTLIYEALKQLDGEINFADFDNDGDGILDGLIVIHQGHGSEESGKSTDIWSHSSTIYGMQFDGINIYRYTIEPELNGTGQSNIGVVCHEFGHNLGASDYYDTDYAQNMQYGGTGRWDLMGSGAWNGPRGMGDYPAPITAWQKIQFGWMQATPLTKGTHVENMPAIGTNAFCYQLNTTVAGDHFILENRQEVTPWDKYCPGHGLLAIHAIGNVLRKTLPTNSINATYPQGLYTVCANAKSDPQEDEPKSYGDVNQSGATFPGTSHVTSFNDDTYPSCRSFGGRRSYVALENITELDMGINFDFVPGDAPNKPENLTATVMQGVVTLTWTIAQTGTQPTHYTIYRNDVEIATTTETTFADNEANTTGIITYTVDASYADGLVSSYAQAETRIPVNKTSELTAEANGNRLTLSWKQPLEITRCVDNMEYNDVEHICGDFRYAHRYRPDDLLPYVGYKIRGINFYPMQASTFASYKVCVWKCTPGSKNPELVSERKVNEFSPRYKRVMLLTSQPTIEPDTEYWIGVQITSNNNVAEVLCDQSELVNEYGNWMSIGGGTWQTDPAATGNYIISATLLAPSSPLTSRDLPSFENIDTDIDLYFPIGFRIYQDNDYVGCTTVTNYTLDLPTDGASHNYSVVSLYKGGNESRPLTIAYPNVDGIASITTNGDDNVTVPVYDLFGKRVAKPTQRGIYISNGIKCIR